MQATSVLASSNPQTTQLSLILPVDRLRPLETSLLSQSDLLQGTHMLSITLRLVPLVQ